MQLNTIRAQVQSDMIATDQMIDAVIHSNIVLTRQISKHLIKSGGKRIRPLLALLSAKAFDYTGQQHITLAAASELLHTATLLHDDVIDASDLRRGKKTANTVWGNKACILVGDWLVTRAFQMLAELEQPEKLNQAIAQLTTQAATKTIEGEILQLSNIGNLKLTEQKYLTILEHKTGQLFEMAAITGPVLCRDDNTTIQIMLEYGKNFGIAFQLIDDALDYAGSNKILGKNIGDDFKEGKLTLPLIHTLKHCDNVQKKLILSILTRKKQMDLKLIQKAIEETDAINYTKRRAKQYVNRAMNTLNQLPSTISTEGLQALTNFIAERVL